MPSDRRGWHTGEHSLHDKLGYGGAVSMAWTEISSGMDSQHQEFHSTRLPFIPVTTLDDTGRPWGSIFAGPGGEIGFVKSSDHYTLIMDINLWEGDPFMGNHKLWGQRDKLLIAGIGIEFPTRRRNKFAGWITDLDGEDSKFKVKVNVNQALGNCPKYINARELAPQPNTTPVIALENLRLSESDRLPEELIAFIHEADTVFLGTSYDAPPEQAKLHPSHLGMNQRGGLPGFVRVRPSDGRTIVLPDFSGNRMMTSLGNIEITPLASLTFVSFATGDILYVTGKARTLVGAEAEAIMFRQNVLTTIRATGYTFVLDALPVRQRPNVPVSRSPYSPPVKFLVEESPSPSKRYFDDAYASLIKIELLSSDIAIFTYEVKDALDIIAGQAVALDFTDFIGPQQYLHMAPWKPTSVNDDRIRTWTVSSAHTHTFSVTVREKPGGAVTGALFMVARKLQEAMPHVLDDTRPLALSVRLVGISGEFILPTSTTTKLLFIAGGIGVTPFLSMLEASARSQEEREVSLVLSTREPEVILPLISKALRTSSLGPTLTLDVFSSREIPDMPETSNIKLRKHQGRVPRGFFSDESVVGNSGEREVYLCGPDEFQQSMVEALGVEGTRIRTEGFNY